MNLGLDKMTEIYHEALLRLVLGLFKSAGFEPGGSISVMRRGLRTFVMRSVVRAESATRRIIIMFERKLKPLKENHRKREKPSKPIPKGASKGQRKRAFSLVDPKRRSGGGYGRKHPPGIGPRMFFIGYDEDPVFETPKSAPMPDDEVSAESLRQRLEALLDALRDPMRQAKRLRRLRARRAGKIPIWPMRYGNPPGFKQKPKKGYTRECERVLYECHKLAYRAVEAANTS